MSDWQPDFDRFEADLNDRDALTSSHQKKIRIHVEATEVWSSDARSQLLANLLLAKEWFTESNPEGVAFDYEVVG